MRYRSSCAVVPLETPDGYVCNHLDDYNVEKNTKLQMELVMDEAHNASKPFGRLCQYDEC